MKKPYIRFKDTNNFFILLAEKEENVNEFSKRTGISPSHIYRLIKGETFPTPKMASKISKGLNVSVDTIFCINND